MAKKEYGKSIEKEGNGANDKRQPVQPVFKGVILHTCNYLVCKNCDGSGCKKCNHKGLLSSTDCFRCEFE